MTATKTLLQQIQAGELKLIVSLIAYKQEKEYVECDTLDEAKALLNRRMAKGWHYVLKGDQFGGLAYGKQHDEVLKALGQQTLAEAEAEYFSSH